MKSWKIGWKVGYIADDYEWIEAKDKREARKLWNAANSGTDAVIVSIEERVDMVALFEEAFEKLADLFRPMKHLQIDDCRGDDKSWFYIPVFYCWMDGDKPESEVVTGFHFSRESYESEAEMVKRFHEELDEFTGRNWKKEDK